MKVSVCARIYYNYEVEVDDNFEYSDIAYCEENDPVYSDITKLMDEKGLDFYGETVSIADENDDSIYVI